MIEAAGGVVLRHDDAGRQVLVVHRPKYDDWSLPKGKLDPGEDAVSGAIREVAEETGVATLAERELAPVHYLARDDQPKRVRWFRLRALNGDPSQRPSDHEVDVARWVDVAEAHTLLTYDTERRVLSDALTEPPP